MKLEKLKKILSAFTAWVLICMITTFKAYTIGAYYTDYEKSSAYASIQDTGDMMLNQYNNVVQKEVKNIDVGDHNISTSNKIVQDGNTKKVYNTIIVKTKKKKNQTAQQVQTPVRQIEKVEKIETTNIVPTTQTIQNINNTNQTNQNKITVNQYTEKTEKTTMDKIRTFFNPFRIKKPDNWYGYALAGYTATYKTSLIASAVYDNNETENNYFDNVKATSDDYKFGGYAIMAGFKFYINQSKLAFFISPEFFYNNIATNEANYKFDTQLYFLANKFGGGTITDALKVPVNVNIIPKTVFGGSIRFGFTICNFFSFFIKGNLGGLRQIINANLDYKNTIFKDANGVEYTGTMPFKDANGDFYQTTLQNVINVQWTDSASTYYVGASSMSKKKVGLAYGIGIGFEMGFWNQHFIIRFDYDHYWSTDNISLDKQFYRYTAADTGGQTNVRTTETGTKWKTKNDFGVFKLTAGLAF